MAKYLREILMASLCNYKVYVIVLMLYPWSIFGQKVQLSQKDYNKQLNNSSAKNYPSPFHEKSKVGYKDSKGNIIIRAKYQAGTEFAEGLALVVDKQIRGFINST